MKDILVVDDEKEIVELIELFLSNNDINIVKAYNGLEALEIMRSRDISLAIVDIMMPELNGFQLIKKLREDFNIPIIVLSARDDFSDKVLGLDIGADDYITKPFNTLELAARVQAQLRRFYKLSGENSTQSKDIINNGELLLNKETCALYKNKRQIQLTSTEYKIVELFFCNLGRVFTKRQIFEYIWGEDYFDDENAIRVHMSNLRDKMEDDPKTPKYLITVRGLGYKVERI